MKIHAKYWVVFILVAMVVPLNLLAFWLTFESNRMLRESVAAANERMLSIRLTEFEQELAGLERYLYDIMDNDRDYNRFIMHGEKDFWMLGGNILFRAFERQISSSPIELGLFALRDEPQAIRLRTSPSIPAAIRAEFNAYLTGLKDEALQCWRMIFINDATCLLRIYKSKGGRIGALVPLTPVLNKMRADFENADLQFIPLDTAPGYDNGEAIRMDSERAGIRLDLKLNGSEGVPVMQRLALVISAVFLLVVPTLYFILHRTLIKPLYQAQIEKYQHKIKEQYHELKSLQLQIRPHFLFNLFNMLHSMASLGDYASIKRLIKLMTEYFRYSIRTGYEKVPLSKELAFLDTYISIASLRYPDCFAFETKRGEDAKDMLIPPLLLHTFIENIFKHTIRMGVFVNILVEIRRESNTAVINISDDGEGISNGQMRNVMDKLNTEGLPEDQEHIGIWNCKKRLEIMYGTRAVLSISSRAAEGTLVSVSLPYEEGGPHDAAAV
jgi:hypothetical protein